MGMHRPNEKGTDVNHSERTSKTSPLKSATLAAVRAPRSAPNGTCPRRPARIGRVARIVLGMAVVLAGALALASPALASGPPYFEPKRLEQEVHSTRVIMYLPLYNNEIATEWQAAYGLSPNGPWTVSNSGTVEVEKGGSARNIGIEAHIAQSEADSRSHLLRHLQPNTQYYARFFAKNSAGEVSEAFSFKTLPVEKPEIPDYTIGVAKDNQNPIFHVGATGPHSIELSALFESNGAQTEYELEYSLFEFGPWTVCASGTVTVAEDFAYPSAECGGLAPETTYFVRAKASNEKGVVEQTRYGGTTPAGELNSVTTLTAKPGVSTEGVRNVTAISAHLIASVAAHGSATHWRFESATSGGGPWTPVPGAAGTISQAEAERNEAGALPVGGALRSLSPTHTYYVRIFAENEAGEATGEARSFETSGSPAATTFLTHALHGGSLRLLGAVNPNNVPTSAEQSIAIEGAPTGGEFALTFDGQTTAGIPYDASAETVSHALNALSSIAGIYKTVGNGEGIGVVDVSGPDGGPYTLYFTGALLAGKVQPQIEGDGSGLTPSGRVAVATTQQGGEAYATDYHFEYEREEEGGEPFVHALSTPALDGGSGSSAEIVGADLPELQAGATYRYRIVAASSSPGDPVVDGGERTLTVPTAPTLSAVESCPNAASRTGPSASLPDCRAYEQLTPVDKEGAQEAFPYAAYTSQAAYPALSGESLLFEGEAVNWGSGPGAGHSPYVFSRMPAGWGMTAVAREPEFGVEKLTPALLDADLTTIGFETEFETSAKVRSKDVQFRVGAPGGPYTVVATVPRRDVEGKTNGWAAESGDSHTLVLQVADRELVTPASTTKSGLDLYEYSGGELRQVNVGIGTCGARIAHGIERSGTTSSVHAVSANGSRIFFEAVPGSNCSGPQHLYARVDGTSTDDLGPSRFLAADETGGEVLVESSGGEVSLFDMETMTNTKLFTVDGPKLVGSPGTVVSSDLGSIYFESPAALTPEAPSVPPEIENGTNIYRYDLAARHLEFLFQMQPGNGINETLAQVTPDGRYAYFDVQVVAGVPGGGLLLVPPGGQAIPGYHSVQVYRYDSVEHVVHCASCASPFDPEPRLGAIESTGKTMGAMHDGAASPSFISENGDYAFFDTPAALVPSDVDGEVAPAASSAIEKSGAAGEFPDPGVSPSSDVYEWRGAGVDGCAQVQGCLSLITNGHGGYLNLLLGASSDGRDVFFYTSSQLVAQDRDTAGDIYDARIDGGFSPPPPGPVECEGDACSTPASPPNDQTPSSLTSTGNGNLVTGAVKSGAKPAKPKKKPKKRKSNHRKHRRKAGSASRARKGGKR